MKREYYSNHSDVLDKDMSMIVYGEGGYPVIAFQAQDAKSTPAATRTGPEDVAWPKRSMARMTQML